MATNNPQESDSLGAILRRGDLLAADAFIASLVVGSPAEQQKIKEVLSLLLNRGLPHLKPEAMQWLVAHGARPEPVLFQRDTPAAVSFDPDRLPGWPEAPDVMVATATLAWLAIADNHRELIPMMLADPKTWDVPANWAAGATIGRGIVEAVWLLAARGDEEMLTQLLAAGEQADALRADGQTLFCRAASQAELLALGTLIRAHADPGIAPLTARFLRGAFSARALVPDDIGDGWDVRFIDEQIQEYEKAFAAGRPDDVVWVPGFVDLVRRECENRGLTDLAKNWPPSTPMPRSVATPPGSCIRDLGQLIAADTPAAAAPDAPRPSRPAP